MRAAKAETGRTRRGTSPPKTLPNAASARERILASALELFSEKGYLGATTREMAREAGVSELTLFRTFGSKARLFEGVLKSYTFLPVLRDLIGTLDALPAHEALRIVGVRFLETLRERKRLLRIMMMECSTYPGTVREIHGKTVSEIRKVFSGYIRARQAGGEFRPSPDAHAASNVFLRMLFSYFLQEGVIYDRPVTDKDIEGTVAQCVEIFLHGMAAEGGRKP